MSAEKTVLGMWHALSDRDWEKLKTFIADDCIYVDMPVGLAAAARGPEDIVKRLKVGLESLSGYENHDGTLVSNGVDVMYEHSETWNWATGESTVLQFVTVHKVQGDKITLWKDYWDFQTLMAAAPAAWHERLDTADLSWVVDVTGRA